MSVSMLIESVEDVLHEESRHEDLPAFLGACLAANPNHEQLRRLQASLSKAALRTAPEPGEQESRRRVELAFLDRLLGAAVHASRPPAGPNRLNDRILRELAASPDGCYPAQLAAMLDASRPQIARALSRLAELGLVEFQVDPLDRRSRRYHLAHGTTEAAR